MQIPEEYLDFFEKPTFAHVATVMDDGSPHSAPVWVGYDGKHILIAGARKHVRHRNMRRDPRVAMTILDPDDPYRALFIRGEVVEMLKEGGIEFLDERAGLHFGTKYPYDDRDRPRYLVKIRPRHISFHPAPIRSESNG